MPIRVSSRLPAIKILKSENIFVMSEKRAAHQDIRPLEIAILNLMPTKITTETQLVRLLGNTPLQVNIELIKTGSYKSKNTSEDHLISFYKSFDSIKHKKYDGMIITGAPVEMMEFEEVDYWNELAEIMEWSKTQVTSTFHICWGAQAALYYHYGIKKYPLDEKLFGVYRHKLNRKTKMLVRGFDDEFYVPQSRHTEVREADLRQVSELEVISTSDEAGVYIAMSHDGSQIFVTGHSEYDNITLAQEYFRDLSKGMKIEIPHNYFPNNDAKKEPPVIWRSHANLLYSNWLNYYVYQTTPFDINDVKK